MALLHASRAKINNDDDQANETGIYSVLFFDLRDSLAPKVVAGNNKAALFGLLYEVQGLPYFAYVSWGLMDEDTGRKKLVILLGRERDPSQPREDEKDVFETICPASNLPVQRLETFCVRPPAVFHARFPYDMHMLMHRQTTNLFFLHKHALRPRSARQMRVGGWLATVTSWYPNRLAEERQTLDWRRRSCDQAPSGWLRWLDLKRLVLPLNAKEEPPLGILVEWDGIEGLAGRADVQTSMWWKQWCQFPWGLAVILRKHTNRHSSPLKISPVVVISKIVDEVGKDEGEDGWSIIDDKECDSDEEKQ